MKRTLVLGFGNLDRQDDGVAYEVINAVRRRLGQSPLGEATTGLEDMDTGMAAVFVPQLGPELVDVAADYERIVFVDAHVHPHLSDVYCTEVQSEFRSSAFSHQLTPQSFLAWLQALYRRRPAGFVLSVRGHSFGFGRGLSEATATRVAPAVEGVLRLLAEGQHSSNGSD